MARFIVPVKDLAHGKSRLQITARAELVVAMLRDVLTAIRGADDGRIVVVTPDNRVAEAVADLTSDCLISDLPLNEAITAAVTDELCAAILPDLPALRPADVMALVASESGFVADARGTGTTMAVSRRLRPTFGPASADGFAAQGLRALDAAPTARRDVDTVSDLTEAEKLGLGANTAAFLARARAGPPNGEPAL